jgi:hypothetical protein
MDMVADELVKAIRDGTADGGTAQRLVKGICRRPTSRLIHPVNS